MKNSKDYLSLGTHNAICDMCGFKFKGTELSKRWDGMMVCSKDFEERHPQDLIKGKNDNQSTPYVRDSIIKFRED